MTASKRMRDYQRWARRGTTEQRGVGHNHRKNRDRAMAALRDGEPCHRCGQPMYRWQALDLDHLTPRILGGTDGPSALTHRHCNRSAGARLGNQLRAGRQPWRQARIW